MSVLESFTMSIRPLTPSRVSSDVDVEPTSHAARDLFSRRGANAHRRRATSPNRPRSGHSARQPASIEPPRARPRSFGQLPTATSLLRSSMIPALLEFIPPSLMGHVAPSRATAALLIFAQSSQPLVATPMASDCHVTAVISRNSYDVSFGKLYDVNSAPNRDRTKTPASVATAMLTGAELCLRTRGAKQHSGFGPC
jgi:hypothetical protein